MPKRKSDASVAQGSRRCVRQGCFTSWTSFALQDLLKYQTQRQKRSSSVHLSIMSMALSAPEREADIRSEELGTFNRAVSQPSSLFRVYLD